MSMYANWGIKLLSQMWKKKNDTGGKNGYMNDAQSSAFGEWG
jgi:hypothetical protein